MAGPITVYNETVAFVDYKWYFTQKRPYVHVLPYRSSQAWSTKPTRGWDAWKPASSFLRQRTDYSVEPIFKRAANKCRDRLYGSISSGEQFLVSLLEGRQSMEMISKRTLQLLRAAREIRRKQFKKAARTLGITQPKGASRSRQFSENWLEFNLGWVPMVKDIGAAVEVLQRDIPNAYFKASGSSRDHSQFTAGYAQYDSTVRVDVRSGVVARLTNPNLYLANLLGFLNPASVAWEAMPLSFVVDYFVPIGAFLDAFTTGVGISFSDGWTTTFVKNNGNSYTWTPPWLPYDISYHEGEGVTVIREPGEISPYPAFVLNSRLSPKRGATLISLLILQLRG